MKSTAHTARVRLFSPHTAVLCAAAALLPAGPALAQQPQLMTNNVRSVVANQETPRLRELGAAQTLKLSIALPLRNETALDSLLQQLYDPASPSYHHWLSVGEFTNRFGPTVDDYEAVTRYAKANGMTIRARTANRLLVDVTASAAQINKAFHVTMGVYRHPTENRTFYAPDRQPTLDVPVKIWHIEGLDNYSIPRPVGQPNLHPVQRNVTKATESTADSSSTSGSGPYGFFLGSDLRAA